LIAATWSGSGLSNAELGRRLRYEIRREFAPYVGVSWDCKLGRMADYARADGDDVEATRRVVVARGFFRGRRRHLSPSPDPCGPEPFARAGATGAGRTGSREFGTG